MARLMAPPVRLKVTRLSRGVYRWEIDVCGDSPDEVLDMVTRLDNELRRRYVPEAPQVQVGGERVRVRKPEVEVPDVAGALGDLAGYVSIEDAGSHIVLTPKQYLGSEVFVKISRVVEGFGGEYLSDGKKSRWIMPKR